jgi:hypothetical protein
MLKYRIWVTDIYSLISCLVTQEESLAFIDKRRSILVRMRALRLKGDESHQTALRRKSLWVCI